MLEFYHCEIHFERGFGVGGVELVIEQFRDQLSAALHEGLLGAVIGRGGKRGDGVLDLPQFGERLNDGEGSLGGLFAFEDGGPSTSSG
jgi:hypothetical protein